MYLVVIIKFQELRSHASFIKQNEYLSHVLELLGYLVRYGYYDDLGDVDDTMIPLIKLLDGQTDLPSLPAEGIYPCTVSDY